MKELVIVPVESGFENILDNPTYLKADPERYRITGYLYFCRLVDNRNLLYRRVPYTYYRNTRNMLVVGLVARHSDHYLMLHVYKTFMQKNGVYYRSSYRNYSYDSNRVNY